MDLGKNSYVRAGFVKTSPATYFFLLHRGKAEGGKNFSSSPAEVVKDLVS